MEVGFGGGNGAEARLYAPSNYEQKMNDFKRKYEENTQKQYISACFYELLGHYFTISVIISAICIISIIG